MNEVELWKRRTVAENAGGRKSLELEGCVGNASRKRGRQIRRSTIKDVRLTSASVVGSPSTVRGRSVVHAMSELLHTSEPGRSAVSLVKSESEPVGVQGSENREGRVYGRTCGTCETYSLNKNVNMRYMRNVHRAHAELHMLVGSRAYMRSTAVDHVPRYFEHPFEIRITRRVIYCHE